MPQITQKKVSKPAPASTTAPRTGALGKAADFFSGSQRYDSASEPGSAPSMATRKMGSQSPAKTGLKAGPGTSGGQMVERTMKSKVAKSADTAAMKPMVSKGRAARY